MADDGRWRVRAGERKQTGREDAYGLIPSNMNRCARAVLLALAARHRACVHVCVCARVRRTACVSSFLRSTHPMPDDSGTQAPRPVDHRRAQPSCCIPGPAARSTWPTLAWRGELAGGGHGATDLAVGGQVRAGAARPSL
jgi:hypothetical protein